MNDVDPLLLERVRARVAGLGGAPSAAAVAAALREEHGGLVADVPAVVAALTREIVGAGPLEVLLADASVTDVLVNGAADVWVDRGAGLERTAIRFRDDAAVRRLAQRLAAPTGRRLDDAQPWVDARLPDGTRLHAVLHPVAPDGTCLSLRVPRRRVFSLDELVVARAVPADGAELLAQVVASRVAFLVTGGTGTGKTTVLSALLSLVDPGERLLLVEDAAELRPDHPHVVRLEARPPNVEGAGEVTLRDLVRQALRMRPDRLVVGEVRGAEVAELLAALNTGHDGGCGTLHANAAADVPARLEALGAMAGIGREALHSQLASALQVVVSLTRDAGAASLELGRAGTRRDDRAVGSAPREAPGVTALLAIGLAAVAAAVLAGNGARWRLAALQPASPGLVLRLPWWALGALAGLTGGPVVAVLGAGGALLLSRLLATRRAGRARGEERRRALEALAVLAADLRAGRSPAEALAAAAEAACGGTSTALASAAAAARVAGNVPGALVGATSVEPEVLRALAACWSVTSVAGSGLAAGVERLEEGLRAAAAQRRAVEAELAGPRATAALLAVLPLAGVLLAYALGADPVHVLLHTPVGLACLFAGLGLDLLGLAWTRRLVARAVPP